MSARYDLSKKTLKAQAVLAKRLNKEEAEPDTSECEEHPEGFKRGGSVPVFYDENDPDVRVFYCQTAEEWCPYD